MGILSTRINDYLEMEINHDNLISNITKILPQIYGHIVDSIKLKSIIHCVWSSDPEHIFVKITSVSNFNSIHLWRNNGINCGTICA